MNSLLFFAQPLFAFLGVGASVAAVQLAVLFAVTLIMIIFVVGIVAFMKYGFNVLFSNSDSLKQDQEPANDEELEQELSSKSEEDSEDLDPSPEEVDDAINNFRVQAMSAAAQRDTELEAYNKMPSHIKKLDAVISSAEVAYNASKVVFNKSKSNDDYYNFSVAKYYLQCAKKLDGHTTVLKKTMRKAEKEYNASKDEALRIVAEKTQVQYNRELRIFENRYAGPDVERPAELENLRAHNEYNQSGTPILLQKKNEARSALAEFRKSHYLTLKAIKTMSIDEIKANLSLAEKQKINNNLQQDNEPDNGLEQVSVSQEEQLLALELEELLIHKLYELAISKAVERDAALEAYNEISYQEKNLGLVICSAEAAYEVAHELWSRHAEIVKQDGNWQVFEFYKQNAVVAKEYFQLVKTLQSTTLKLKLAMSNAIEEYNASRDETLRGDDEAGNYQYQQSGDLDLKKKKSDAVAAWNDFRQSNYTKLKVIKFADLAKKISHDTESSNSLKKKSP